MVNIHQTQNRCCCCRCQYLKINQRGHLFCFLIWSTKLFLTLLRLKARRKKKFFLHLVRNRRSPSRRKRKKKIPFRFLFHIVQLFWRWTTGDRIAANNNATRNSCIEREQHLLLYEFCHRGRNEMFAPPMVCICRGTDGRIGIDHPFRVWALVQQETKTIAFSFSVFSFLYLLDNMVLTMSSRLHRSKSFRRRSSVTTTIRTAATFTFTLRDTC